MTSCFCNIPLLSLWISTVLPEQLLFFPLLFLFFLFSFQASQFCLLITCCILLPSCPSFFFLHPSLPSRRRSLSPVPQSRCKRGRSEAAEPGPARRAGSAEGEKLPHAQNRSHQTKLAAQSRTQIPSSSAGLPREESGPAEIFLLVVWCFKKKKERKKHTKKKSFSMATKKDVFICSDDVRRETA